MTTDPKRMTPEQWARHWQARIDAAQLETRVEIGGQEYERLPYGAPGDHNSVVYPECPDCAARVGQLHVAGCDTETCPACGGQALGCDCGFDVEVLH
jgi:hypothetical protein